MVNQVAAPIKFLEYLSCGVNVIMTDAVPSYAKLIEETNVGTVVDMNAKTSQSNHIIIMLKKYIKILQ